MLHEEIEQTIELALLKASDGCSFATGVTQTQYSEQPITTPRLYSITLRSYTLLMKAAQKSL
jgi:hypothetical protein